MIADGRGVTRLTNSLGQFDPAAIVWSPDDTKIGFQAGGDIYVINADGSSLVNVTNNAAADGGSVWSPNGSKIAFWTNRDGNDEIYVMNAYGSRPALVSNNPSAGRAAACDPHGQPLAVRNGV